MSGLTYRFDASGRSGKSPFSIGIGTAQGTTTIVGSSFPTALTTKDFAFKNANPFLTGVVYNDNVTTDNFYTPGEGIGGTTITARPVGGGHDHFRFRRVHAPTRPGHVHGDGGGHVPASTAGAP